MPRTATRERLLALLLVPAMIAALVVTSDPAAVSAASTAWTLPSMPAKCNDQQKASGDVASCLLDGTPAGLPEKRGWPAPPFPTATEGTAIPWVTLQIGSSGTAVVKVQLALNDLGYDLVADGQYGPKTAAAVTAFQVSVNVEATGIVDEETAAELGVQNTEPGTFPGPGWTWLGWAYNGSAALASWESRMVTNSTKIGPVRVSQIRTLPEALPLYEGFLREIVAGGYTIRDAGNYAFRCTSNAGKTCNGLSRESLSNHSWGLALDMNTAYNPEKTYLGAGGATACATPMTTDIPQWVVKAAEHWGLYWGGYGWSGGGCSSPSQIKSSVLRDPMHFEFRGTPTQALAIAARNSGHTLVCYDVASNAGAISNTCLLPGAVPAAGTRTVVYTEAPTGSTAALVNITLTAATGTGYVTAESCGAVSGDVRSSSNGNVVAGRTVANLAVVPVDSSGRFCLYQSVGLHAIVDVQGFFGSASAMGSNGMVFSPITPERIIDTRIDGFCPVTGQCAENGPVPAETPAAVVGPDMPPSAVAMLANLTVTGAQASGYLTADACAALTPGLQAHSNANFERGETVANLSVVPALSTPDGGQICTYASTGTQQIVDVQGWFVPPAAGGWGYTSMSSQRLVDTRQCWTDPVTAEERCNQVNEAGSILHVQAPAGASAVLVNLTLADATGSGYATAGKCSAMAPGPQSISNGNVETGGTSANLSVVPVDTDGMFCVYVSTGVHVLVDLQGTFASAASLRFSPIAPVRRFDSRG